MAIGRAAAAAGTDWEHRAGPGSAVDRAVTEVNGSAVAVLLDPGWLPVMATILLVRIDAEEDTETDG